MSTNDFTSPTLPASFSDPSALLLFVLDSTTAFLKRLSEPPADDLECEAAASILHRAVQHAADHVYDVEMDDELRSEISEAIQLAEDATEAVRQRMIVQAE